MNYGNTYKVFTLTQEFVTRHPNDYENMVALQSKQVSPFIIRDDKTVPDTIEGLVRIQNASDHSKCIYRKAVGAATFGLDGDHAMLSARSMKQLDVKEYDTIIIKPTNGFCYLWHYYDTSIRCPFHIAIYLGLASIILSLISIGISIFCCCCH